MFYAVKFSFIFGFKNFYKLKCKFWFHYDEDVNSTNVWTFWENMSLIWNKQCSLSRILHNVLDLLENLSVNTSTVFLFHDCIKDSVPCISSYRWEVVVVSFFWGSESLTCKDLFTFCKSHQTYIVFEKTSCFNISTLNGLNSSIIISSVFYSVIEAR